MIAFVLPSNYRARLKNWPSLIAFLASSGAYEAFDVHRRGWVSCLIIGLAIPHFRETPVRIVRGVAAYIVNYSYGIYLFHLIAIYFCFKYLHVPMILKVIGAVAATVIASVISFHLIEAPLVRCGQRLGRCVAVILGGTTTRRIFPSGTQAGFSGNPAARSRPFKDEVQTTRNDGILLPIALSYHSPHSALPSDSACCYAESGTQVLLCVEKICLGVKQDPDRSSTYRFRGPVMRLARRLPPLLVPLGEAQCALFTEPLLLPSF